jgi:SAM-dependent methyltransferase
VPRHARAGAVGASTVTAPPASTAVAARDLAEPFTRPVLDYAAQHAGQPITVLRAGCVTAGAELDLDTLRASGCAVAVTMVDDDNPVTRSAVAQRGDLSAAVLGELRSVPLAPRSFDVVQCSLLLDRISHAELVLGRLTEALRPGGLLLLRTVDRYSAAAFLDRVLPRPVRTGLWHRRRPGEPGPYPAVYEELTSARGIQSFAGKHGLVISYRQVGTGVARQSAGLQAVSRLVAVLSGGRLASEHDELWYVIRKPEDMFARVL